TAAPASAGNSCSATSYFALLRSTDTGGVALSSGGFEAGAQLFEAPQALDVTGFSFFAFVHPGEEASVVAALYLGDEDGLPSGAPLASTVVSVTGGAGSLESMRQQATFESSVRVQQDYLLVIENDSATPLQLIANSAGDGDGRGEGLSSLRTAGVWQSGLDVTLQGLAFDADFLLQPDYRVVDFFVGIETQSPCLEAPGALEFTADASPVFTSRFYNVDFESAFSWEFGDGSKGSGTTVQNTYDSVGPWPVRNVGTLRSGQGDVCSAQGSGFFGAIPIVEEVVILDDFSSFRVTFFPNAMATEDWLWDFGDGATSTAQAPVHFYPGLGFFTACVTASNRCGEIPQLCLEVLSPFPDISVAVETEVAELDPGSPLSYTVLVSNFSGAASGPQTLSLEIPAGLSGVSWTCSVSGTGTCTPAGMDSIQDAIQLDPQSTLTYTVTGTYPSGSTAPLFLFAEATVPGGDETANNADSALVFATGTLFADGFETGDLSRWLIP
ncbi:MAG: PKD domain-containing protein, partial [Acidobacteriota bacterium]